MQRSGTAIRGSRVLVTGGGRGLGRRIALRAAARGAAEVVVWDVDTARAQEVADEISAHRRRTSVATVDITDPAAVTAAAAGTGDVDVVVNCAGVVTGRRLVDADEAAIRRTFEVNTLALYWVTRAFLPGMVARDRGTVVTIASAAGMVGVARQTDYSASKFAAVGFTESLRAELRGERSRVRTLLVCPYYIDTGMFDGVRTRVPWLLPILREDDVARTVVEGIERGRSQIVLPPAVWLVPGLRLLGTRGFDALVDVLGINHTMDHFVGRAPHD
jgi:all-trans-retinol dehydrogenase (NAD+)